MAQVKKRNAQKASPATEYTITWPDSTYTLKLKDHYLYCTCPSWKFQKATDQPRLCKHMKAFYDMTTTIAHLFSSHHNNQQTSPTATPKTSSPEETKKDRKSTRLNSSHTDISRMPSSA